MLNNLLRAVMRKRQAYRAVFEPGGLVSPAASIVLSDLADFCRARKSTTIVSMVTQQVDPIASAQAEGRREVFLRIMQHIHVTDADLYKILNQQIDGTD